MALIKFSTNKYTSDLFFEVDKEDVTLVNQHSWYLEKSTNQKGYSKYYVRTSINNKHIRLHRFIMNVSDPKIQIDHINGNTLDNKKNNLRLASSIQNAKNQPKRKCNTSGYKGVSFDKSRNQWMCQIHHKGKKIYMKRFNSAEEAAKAYDSKVKELFGEFAKLNYG